MLFFKKKKEPKELKCFLSGELIAIDKVNDQVFSQKMMGDGIAVIPSDNSIYAPADAQVTAIFDSTEHAIGFTLDNGMEILIHCGLDTVALTEKVFSCLVKKGDRVRQGQKVITFDHDKLKALNYDDVTMLVVLNPGNAKNIVFAPEGSVTANDSVVATYE
ncbi:MAG: PTS glucose transporter subunit IIA [Bulleidia sp.]